MMTHIKALRWVALKLDLAVLTAPQSQTVSDFLKTQRRIPFGPSEATPIPLAVLAAWEQRILSDDSSLPEITTLGPLYASETCCEQSLKLSVFKAIYFVESPGIQRRLYQDNHGEFAVSALLLVLL